MYTNFSLYTMKNSYLTGSGELEFEEFCTLAARFLVEEDTEAMQQELREAFRLYDKEGNGYITTDVFRDILHELDDKLSPEELDQMIEEIDADGSGTLDFDGKITFSVHFVLQLFIIIFLNVSHLIIVNFFFVIVFFLYYKHLIN